MKKMEIDIKGMHCNSCTMLVKDALSEIKGVKEVKVDLKKGNAIVDVDEKIVDKDELVLAVQNEGYEAKIAK